MEQKRLLIIDDNQSIHRDYMKILGPQQETAGIAEVDEVIFGSDRAREMAYDFPVFQIDSAFQGEQGLALVRAARLKKQPYTLAFVDVLMPPGWDGIHTVEQLWKVDPDLQVVICTAHSGSSFDEIYKKFKGADNFLILKKPFDMIEIRQVALALTKKWELNRYMRQHIGKQRARIESFSHEAEFLHNLSQLSQTDFNTLHALQFFVDGICKLRGWPIGRVFRVEYDALAPTEIWHIAGKPKEYYLQIDEAQKNLEAGFGLAEHALATQRPCWFSEEEVSALQKKEYLSHIIRDSFSVPVKRYNETIAVVEFFSKEIIPKEKGFLDFMSTAANQLGVLLERRKNEKELKKNYDELKKLYDELQVTQTQFLQHAKHIAVGQLAAGIAHEISNPIASVVSNTSSLKTHVEKIQSFINSMNIEIERMDASTFLKTKELWRSAYVGNKISLLQDEINNILKESLSGLERAREIVKNMKTFSLAGEGDFKEADVNQCLEDTLNVVWNELKYKCTVKKSLAPLPAVMCNTQQLEQVFVNLLVNAAQAIPDKGEIYIKTNANDSEIQIEISDTGVGISPEQMEHLFDPFFTTKPAGVGTGLGLFISYNIIQKHHGRIEVNSSVGKGTSFIISLPLKKEIKSK